MQQIRSNFWIAKPIVAILVCASLHPATCPAEPPDAVDPPWSSPVVVAHSCLMTRIKGRTPKSDLHDLPIDLTTYPARLELCIGELTTRQLPSEKRFATSLSTSVLILEGDYGKLSAIDDWMRRGSATMSLSDFNRMAFLIKDLLEDRPESFCWIEHSIVASLQQFEFDATKKKDMESIIRVVFLNNYPDPFASPSVREVTKAIRGTIFGELRKRWPSLQPDKEFAEVDSQTTVTSGS